MRVKPGCQTFFVLAEARLQKDLVCWNGFTFRAEVHQIDMLHGGWVHVLFMAVFRSVK